MILKGDDGQRVGRGTRKGFVVDGRRLEKNDGEREGEEEERWLP